MVALWEVVAYETRGGGTWKFNCMEILLKDPDFFFFLSSHVLMMSVFDRM